jgi:hypothetical protein
VLESCRTLECTGGLAEELEGWWAGEKQDSAGSPEGAQRGRVQQREEGLRGSTELSRKSPGMAVQEEGRF